MSKAKGYIDNTKSTREERANKEAWLKRIERDMKGNPKLKRRGIPFWFPTPTEAQAKRLAKADQYGNLPQKKSKKIETKKLVKTWIWDKKLQKLVEKKA